MYAFEKSSPAFNKFCEELILNVNELKQELEKLNREIRFISRLSSSDVDLSFVLENRIAIIEQHPELIKTLQLISFFVEEAGCPTIDQVNQLMEKVKGVLSNQTKNESELQAKFEQIKTKCEAYLGIIHGGEGMYDLNFFVTAVSESSLSEEEKVEVLSIEAYMKSPESVEKTQEINPKIVEKNEEIPEVVPELSPIEEGIEASETQQEPVILDSNKLKLIEESKNVCMQILKKIEDFISLREIDYKNINEQVHFSEEYQKQIVEPYCELLFRTGDLASSDNFFEQNKLKEYKGLILLLSLEHVHRLLLDEYAYLEMFPEDKAVQKIQFNIAKSQEIVNYLQSEIIEIEEDLTTIEEDSSYLNIDDFDNMFFLLDKEGNPYVNFDAFPETEKRQMLSLLQKIAKKNYRSVANDKRRIKADYQYLENYCYRKNGSGYIVFAEVQSAKEEGEGLLLVVDIVRGTIGKIEKIITKNKDIAVSDTIRAIQGGTITQEFLDRQTEIKQEIVDILKTTQSGKGGIR